MAKALKIGALVVGVAALAVVTGGAAVGLGVSLGTTLVGTGISAGGLLLASTALSAGAALLQKKPSVTAAQTDRLTASIDPRTPRKTVLGSTAFPIDVRYEEWSGPDQDYCDWIVCFASHAIDGLDELWFNTELAWSAARGVEPKFRGYFFLAGLVLEGAPGNAMAFGGWHGASLTGCAYARFRFKVTGNSKKAESPFSSGPPSRITAIGRGAKLYDPRRDSTVPGGSGPMRADDQSTWRFTADDGAMIGDNLPLQILRVVLGWRIQNPQTGEWKLATGSGVPARRLDLGSWIEAANLADELVNRSAGGQEPRYHGAAVVSEGDDPKTTLDMLCAASCARFRDTGGRLALAIAHNDLAAAALDDGLLDDDVVGPFSWDPDPALEATPNVIRGRYVDATSAGLYQLIDYPEVRIASPDGQDRFFPLDLGAVESPSQAQRIAKQKLQRLQYQREFSATFDIRAWKYGVGDVVPFTFAPLSFARALFRVKEQELGQGGTCQMTLTVEHQAMYAWDADDRAPVIAAEPLVYDASKNPLVLAIADAGGTATWDGVTGIGKPEDFATVGAPTGTKVGDRDVDQLLRQVDEALENAATDVAAILEQADTRATEIVADAEARLDQAIDSADQRAKDAQADADTALLTLNDPASGALRRVTLLETALDDPATGVYARIAATDSVLNTPTTGIAARVTELEGVAFGGGGGQDGFAARISGLEMVVGDATKGLVQQANRLEVNSVRGGNLVPGSGVPTLDGWGVTHNPSGGGMYRNAPDANYMIGGAENNVTLRAPAYQGIAIEAQGTFFGVRAGSTVQFYAMAHAHRARPWATLFFYNAADQVVGYTGDHIGAPGGSLGLDIGVWQRLGTPAFPVPAGAVKARVAFRIYDVSADGYGWFSRPFVSEVKPGATEWVPYSPGSDSGTIASVTAVANSLTFVVGNAAGGLVKRTSDLESTLTAPGVGVVAKLGSLEQVVTAAGSGLVSKVGTLELSVRTSGNLLTNSEFALNTVGWSFNTESGSVGRRDWPGSEWWPNGLHVLNIHQPNALTTRGGLWVQVVEGLEGKGFLQLSAWVATHRCLPSLWIDFVDANGVQTGGIGHVHPIERGGGKSLALYERAYVNVEVPAGSARAYCYLGKQGTHAGGDSYAWFIRPQLVYVASPAAPLVPYSPGSGEAMLVNVNTRVTDVTQVVGDANGGLVKRTNDIEAAINTPGTGVVARIGAAERAISNADGTGLAQRTASLEVSAYAGGNTENANPDFSAWPDSYANPVGWVPWSGGGNSTRSPATLGKGGYAMDRIADALDSGVCVPSVFLTGGWYVVSAKVWKLSGGWAGAGVTWGGVGGAGLDFMRDRDNAGKIGDIDTGGVREWTKLVYIDASWASYRAFHAMDNWSGLGFGAVPKSLRWLYCGIRKASDAEVRGNDASDQLERPGGVKARIDRTETTIADLPNRYAAASRTESLEAQVNGAAGSNLLSRATTSAQAAADAALGAANQRMNVMVAEYNNIGARVTEQAGTIVDVNYRTRAYIRSEAVAGNNRAQLAIYADSNNGAGVDIIGNVSISGNLLVGGSVQGTHIADGAVTGSATRGGMSGYGASAGEQLESERLGFASGGGTMKIDVMADGARVSGSGAGFMFAQLFMVLDGSETALSRPVAFSASNRALPVSFFALTELGAGRSCQFFLRFSVEGAGIWSFSSAAIAAVQFKK